jgi:DNA-binding CsgD family transcriptional regulator
MPHILEYHNTCPIFTMPLTLSEREIDRVRDLSRLMVSPLGLPELREWLDRINDGLIRLTGADRALSALPMRDPDSVMVRNFDPGVVTAFLSGPVDEDPALARVMRERPPVVHQSMIYGEDLERLALFQEFLRPWGIVNSAAFNVFLPGGGLAVGGVMKGDRVDRAFQLRTHALLELLQPSFQAGVEQLVRMGHRGADLARLLDALEEPVALYAGTGRLVHANRRLIGALRPDPEAEVVWTGLAGVAGAMGGREGPEPVFEAVTRISTDRQRYRVVATVVGEDVLGREPGVLVRVALLDRARATADDMIARYGLTEREAEVALHLGRGETDREIADRLGISWHTVRTHVERVLGKLGVDSRARVIRMIARSDAGG